MKKIIIIVLALAIVSGYLFWRFGPDLTQKPKQTQNKQVTLNILALWDEENLMKVAFDEYKKTHPNVTIKYTHTTSKNYLSRVQTKISAGEELDIFMLHNSWLPIFLKNNSLAPLPKEIMAESDYSKIFYPVVSQSFSKNNLIFAIPRGIDGLALYYNEDILKSGAVEVPRTWEEFRNAATKLTVIDQNNKIQTAGAALGTASNVDHFSDILGLLYFQNPGAKLETPDSEAGVEALKFYTGFVTDPAHKSWDASLERSTQAFASGRLAFYFAPSWRAHELRQLNPELKFRTAPVPQLPSNPPKTVGWGTFWGYAVSSKSKNPQASWEFLKFLTSDSTQKLLYQEASKVRLFGLPYSSVNLQKELADDPIVGAFVTQAPSYKSWYLASNTQDQAINDQMIKYFEDGVNSILQGESAEVVLETVAQGVEQVLNQYNPATPAPSGQ